MKSDFNYYCSACEKEYPWNSLEFQCDCGGLFQVNHGASFDADLIESSVPSLMRYAHAFPETVREHMASISLGEGWTGAIARSSKEPNVIVKMDHLMPTLSFKDRGAIVLVAIAKAIGVDRIVQDSSGNAGHAVATYAARAGIECEIFVPKDCSPKKIAMIEATGSKANIVKGSREHTADATLQAASQSGTFYASHVYNPLFYEGTRTYVFEIFEQLGRLPDRMIVPLGNGTLVLGVAKAIEELAKSGLTQDACQIVAVQAENCAPIHKAFQNGTTTVGQVDNLGTAAEGIAIARPKRGDEVLAAINQTGGEIWVSREVDLLPTLNRMRRLGFDIEPTTAATFAAFDAQTDEPSDLVVLPCCGSGAKK